MLLDSQSLLKEAGNYFDRFTRDAEQVQKNPDQEGTDDVR
jgi:hypothetical protein